MPLAVPFPPADLQKAISTRTQLVSQHTENEGVLDVGSGVQAGLVQITSKHGFPGAHARTLLVMTQELNRLGDDANVFKLIGPALIKQDLIEAKSNVSKRIEYIKGEVDRVDGQIKSLEGKSKEKEAEVRSADSSHGVQAHRNALHMAQARCMLQRMSLALAQ